MNKHICRLLSLCCIALFFCAPSSTGLAAEKPLPALGDILKGTEACYQRLHAYTAHFRQRTTSASAGAMTTEADGTLYYQKPRRMRWEYATPERQIFVANQDLAWLYAPEDKQISMFEGKTFFDSPLARTFFDGVFELRKNFDVTLEARESTNATAVLKLKPRQEDPHIDALKLWINLSDHRIVSLETRDAMGNINRLILEDQKDALSLDPKLFRLDVPEGVMVTNAEGRELDAKEVEEVQKATQTK